MAFNNGAQLVSGPSISKWVMISFAWLAVFALIPYQPKSDNAPRVRFPVGSFRRLKRYLRPIQPLALGQAKSFTHDAAK